MFRILRAHLGCQFLFAGECCDQACFFHGVRQRFFTVHMQTASQSAYGGRRVVMIRSGDDDRVQVLLFQQLPVIGIFSGTGVAAGGCFQEYAFDVIQGNDVFGTCRVQVSASTPSSPHPADIYPVIGRRGPCPAGVGSGGVHRASTAPM